MLDSMLSCLSDPQFFGYPGCGSETTWPVYRGGWAGPTVHSSHGSVFVLIAQERWDKTKTILTWIQDQLRPDHGFDHKLLEKYRGYLVYVSRTYQAMTPYLKGIHLTLDHWRPWQKEDGWKMTQVEISTYLQDKQCDQLPSPTTIHPMAKPPAVVYPVPRLSADVTALLTLFSSLTPTKCQVRPTHTSVVLYGFADASGQGFGSTLILNGRIHFCHGQWTPGYSDESSNFRELDNLISAIESAYHDGLLLNAKLFMFTDNFVAESAFYKGTSTSPRLFDLVLRLWCLQMSGDIALHVIHIAGTRMIAEGTDGLSRGQFSTGVMAGKDILLYIPLHLDAVTRQPSLYAWVTMWHPSPNPRWLTPEHWFDIGQTQDQFIWTPPPAAADVAIELVAKAKHKRPSHFHVILVPRLLTSRWRKLMSKVCDFVFTVPVGTDIWPDTHHEPLIIGLALPLIIHRPWRLRGTQPLESTLDNLRHLPKTTPQWGGVVLHQLLLFTGGLDQLQASVRCPCYSGEGLSEFPINEPTDEDGYVTLKEQDKSCFLIGRMGDHLMCPFQCDTCHFRNIQKRDPLLTKSEDIKLLRCIRRANLDIGKYAPTVQFSTMQKMRSAFSNVYQASAVGISGSSIMAKDTRKLIVTDCPTYGVWFEHFVRGCHKRMGDIVKPDRALSLAVLHQMLQDIEEEWDKAHGGERYALA
jgi:hypothetical protein